MKLFKYNQYQSIYNLLNIIKLIKIANKEDQLSVEI